MNACVIKAIPVARGEKRARHFARGCASGAFLMDGVYARKAEVYVACLQLVRKDGNLSWAAVDGLLPMNLGQHTVRQKSWALRHLTMILAVLLHELKLPQKRKDIGGLRDPPPTESDWRFAWQHYDNRQKETMTFIGCGYDDVVGKLLPQLGGSSLIDFISFFRDARGSFARR